MRGSSLLAWIFGVVGVTILVLIPFAYDIFPFLPPGWINDYTLHVLINGFYFALLASSWSLLMGYAGQFSFAHLAFAGVGAYTTGLLGRHIGTTPLTGIIIGTLMAGLFGLIIGMLVLRLRKTYLALFTIAFAEIFRLVISAEKDYTGGPNGLALQPLFPNGLDLGFYTFNAVHKIPPYFVMLALLLVMLALMSWLANSRFGLFLMAIREDEEAAEALGVNVVRYKVLVFVVTSMVAGLAGATRAHYVTLIAPNDMIILWMSLVITMSVLGGIESLVASAIGGIVVFVSLEYLRTNLATTTVMAVILTGLLAVGLYRLVEYGLKRTVNLTLKGPRRVLMGLGTLIVAGLIVFPLSLPVTTGLSYAYYDLSGSLFPETIDMGAWRLVFFGLVLMLTLRFYQNGLLYPVMQYLFRTGDLRETVAKREITAPVAEPGQSSAVSGQ